MGAAGLVVSLAFHLGALYACSIYLYEAYVLMLPGRDDFGGQFKYLTQLSHWGETLYFATSVIHDVVLLISGGRKAVRSGLDHFVDSWFAAQFTLANMVGLLFWAIFFYDRELILPKQFENIYRPELNMFQHGWVAVLMLADWMISERRYHHIWKHVGHIVTIDALYISWTFVCVYMNERWPYPFQREMNWWQHIIFFVGNVPLSVVVLWIGKKGCDLRWGPEAAPSGAAETKRGKVNSRKKRE